MPRKKKQKFTKVTKTAINLWCECPRHFYYKYISNTAKPTQKIVNWRMILGWYLHHFFAYYMNRPHSDSRPFFFINSFLANCAWKDFYTKGVRKELASIYTGEDGVRKMERSIARTLGFGRRAVGNYWDIFKSYPPPLEVEKRLSMDLGYIAPGFRLVGIHDEMRSLRSRKKIDELYPNTSFT